MRPASPSQYLRGFLAQLRPYISELLIRVPRLEYTCGRDDPRLVMVLEVRIDTGELDEDGKIGREARRVIEVRRG